MTMNQPSPGDRNDHDMEIIGESPSEFPNGFELSSNRDDVVESRGQEVAFEFVLVAGFNRRQGYV